MDTWSTIATAGPLGVVFIVLTTLVLRLSQHLSSDRTNQIKVVSILREQRDSEIMALKLAHVKEVIEKDSMIQRYLEQIETLRHRVWESEDLVARYKRAEGTR